MVTVSPAHVATLGLKDLEAFDARRWASAGRVWEDSTGQVAATHRGLTSTGHQLESWSGDAAAWAAARLGRMQADLEPAVSILSYVNGILEDVVATVTACRERASQAARAARGAGCTVTDEGVVVAPDQPSPPGPGRLPPPVPGPFQPAVTPPRARQALSQQQAAAQRHTAAQQQAVYQLEAQDLASLDASRGLLVRQAAAWQDTIQSALAAARMADEEAAYQLRLLVPGAKDLVDSLHGASPTAGLDGLENVAGSLPEQAAALLDRAAWYDVKDLPVLEREYGHLSRDPYFATALMNRIGPGGIANVEEMMAIGYQRAVHDGVTPSPAQLRYARTIDSFLASNLASATRGLTARSGGGTAEHVSESWLRQFIATGDGGIPALQTSGSGWWGIGQVLASVTARDHLSPHVLLQISSAMLKWEQAGGHPVGPADSVTDPVVGLLHAASRNPKTSRELLHAPGPGGGKQTTLQYLLDHHRWGPGDRSDGGRTLGQVIAAATRRHSVASNRLAASVVRLYGHKLLTDPGFGRDTPGLRAGVGRLLAAHLGLLHHPASARGVTTGLPSEKEVQAVVAQVHKDPAAAHRLAAAEAAAKKRAEEAAQRRQEQAAVGPVPPGQVGHWIGEAAKILEAHGTPARDINGSDIALIISHESSGIPNNVNHWDINAQEGHPSIGLMQVIQPTFDTYALPGHGDIYNPVDNIIAGVRYAIARYGSIQNVPGVVAVHDGQPYVGY